MANDAQSAYAQNLGKIMSGFTVPSAAPPTPQAGTPSLQSSSVDNNLLGVMYAQARAQKEKPTEPFYYQ